MLADSSLYDNIKSMSEDEFISVLNNTYSFVKGTYTEHKPMFNTHVSIEFTLALLIKEYSELFLSYHSNDYSALLLNLADNLGCAFMGMPDYEWGPIFEKTLTAYSDLIPLNDCQKSFDLLELRHFNTIISMPFCYGNNIVSYTTEMNQNNTYYRNFFVPLYNSVIAVTGPYVLLFTDVYHAYLQ